VQFFRSAYDHLCREKPPLLSPFFLGLLTALLQGIEGLSPRSELTVALFSFSLLFLDCQLEMSPPPMRAVFFPGTGQARGPLFSSPERTVLS